MILTASVLIIGHFVRLTSNVRLSTYDDNNTLLYIIEDILGWKSVFGILYIFEFQFSPD